MTALKLAVRDLVADRGRTLLSVAAIAPVVAAYLILMGVSGGLSSEAVEASGQNIVILSPNSLDPAAGRLDPGVLDLAAGTAGTDAAGISPLMFRPVKVDETIIQLRAAPLGDWEAVHRLTLLDGRLPQPGADEAVVTEGVAVATGWRVSDLAEVYGTTFTITGLVRASGTKFASMWMDFERAERLFEGSTGFQMVMVRPAPGADAADVRARLAAAAGDEYGVYFESDVAAQQTGRLEAAGTLAALALIVGAAALGFGSFNLTALTMAERRGDLGILRSLGFSSAAIGTVAVIRSLLLALAGFALGGIAASAFVFSAGTTTLRSFVIDAAVPASSWIWGLAVCLAVTALGSLLAVRRAAGRRIRSLLEAA